MTTPILPCLTSVRHIINVDIPVDFNGLEDYTLFALVFNAIGVAILNVSVCIFILRMTHRTYRLASWLVYVNLSVLVAPTII